ncbi:hypothetical protein [Chryseobacterium gallinarum]|uniref:hypothetical protein n=1 Tax=Chryseobacterium gallinarum TaxID=1324352 RepID=UPI0032AFD089
MSDNFDTETHERGLGIIIPQEELDEVFGEDADFNFNDEEEEWMAYGEPNSESGFAQGVTYQELTTVGALLQHDVLEPPQEETAVDLVQRIQGTELFGLLENSIEGISEKIARLLDRNLPAESSGTDSGSSTQGKDDFEGFDIGEFV